MGLNVIWCKGVDWIHLVQGTKQWWALVCIIMNSRCHKRCKIPWLFEKLFNSFSRRTLLHGVSSTALCARKGEDHAAAD
jgi:hypothetical protein